MILSSRVQSLVSLESVDSLDICDHHHDGTCEYKDERDNAQSSDDIQANKVHYEAMVSTRSFVVDQKKTHISLGASS